LVKGKHKQARALSPGGGSEMTTIVQKPSEDLEEHGARWGRDTQLIREIVQLENDLGRELSLSDVYRKFGSRIAAINDVLRFLVKYEEGPN
jgi:hypothetical protein